MAVFMIESAELTLRDGRQLRVDVREQIDAFVPAFFTRRMSEECPLHKPGSCPGNDMLVVIDGRMYRNVMGLVYVNDKGERLDALKE